MQGNCKEAEYPSYSFDLDWEKECIVARKLAITAKKFKMQVSGLIKKLDQVAKNEESE